MIFDAFELYLEDLSTSVVSLLLETLLSMSQKSTFMEHLSTG